MHVISRKKLRDFWTAHPDAEAPLSEWYKVARRSRWRKFADIRAVYGSADQVGKFVVFNIGGNKYRLVIDIYYQDAVILIRHVLTHKDYDGGQWKARPSP
jgi:mRNA interferase HigB